MVVVVDSPDDVGAAVVVVAADVAGSSLRLRTTAPTARAASTPTPIRTLRTRCDGSGPMGSWSSPSSSSTVATSRSKPIERPQDWQ